MKTFKFVASIVLLISIFIAFLAVLFAPYFSKRKGEQNEARKNKIRLIAFVYIAAATVAVAILMLI